MNKVYAVQNESGKFSILTFSRLLVLYVIVVEKWKKIYSLSLPPTLPPSSPPPPPSLEWRHLDLDIFMRVLYHAGLSTQAS